MRSDLNFFDAARVDSMLGLFRFFDDVVPRTEMEDIKTKEDT